MTDTPAPEPVTPPESYGPTTGELRALMQHPNGPEARRRRRAAAAARRAAAHAGAVPPPPPPPIG